MNQDDSNDQGELLDIVKKLKDRKDCNIHMDIKSNAIKFVIGVIGNGGRNFKLFNKHNRVVFLFKFLNLT